MENQPIHATLEGFRTRFDGEIFTDDLWRIMYATDASAYREIPIGVARPKNAAAIKQLIGFANQHSIPLIPRTAGTSLAGQVVGNGLVVDVSKYLNSILEFNPEEHWIRVEPGVILDELNKFVEPHGLFFGPETSTSSRCMIGGMVGNNSCGAHSILYGSTRDHVLSIRAFLSDGSEAEFGPLSKEALTARTKLDNLEGEIYRNIFGILSDPEKQDEIRKEFPKPSIHRRNTGYAIDRLLDTFPFSGNEELFNLSKLIAGSEGTLAFVTEIKLNLVPLPPKEKGLICIHCKDVAEALEANLLALTYNPGSVELMDKAIMDCTLENTTQAQNRFFIQGDPGAILIIEFARTSREEIHKIAEELEKEMRSKGLGNHFPVVFPPDLKRVWDLRKAGLGVLSNYPGDRKPVPVTEDTAVSPEDLPEYIREFHAMMISLKLKCVYYAHVGSGELHLRPVLNLKDPCDVELFHEVAERTARLVKKFNGSLSGEHGDGRLRGEFIPYMIGEKNYKLLQDIKNAWDPHGIFNPQKITGTPKMNSSLRFQPGFLTPDIQTVFDFSSSHGILRAAEQCIGSGDCRNTILTGKWMCPSYMAVKDEDTSTRARANVLREFLTHSKKANRFDHPEIYRVMDLCLSCKACKTECPANVDIAKLKAEFLQHYYDAHGIPLRTRLIAYITSINKIGILFPGIFNFFTRNTFFSGLFKKMTGFASARSIPLLHSYTLRNWANRNPQQTEGHSGTVYLFADEFTNYNDVDTGIKAIKLLNSLGYKVILPDHTESGRTFLSKGMIRKAKKIARHNITLLKDLISKEQPLVGIEPSAILCFRDEYIDLAGDTLKDDARKLSGNCLLFDEFILRETAKGKIRKEQFTKKTRHIRLHGHCHQKALASVESTRKMLLIPENFQVEEIKSGCCGMAGSFGYEKEHYEVSMKVGELVLFPEIRKTNEETIIAAPGTSCRHQILDGTGRKALHPIEVLFDALEGKKGEIY
jgi:FAD/FMN-containing dehydrogenase/Fe-S oxidoreductase